jgi:hypothetical protein
MLLPRRGLATDFVSERLSLPCRTAKFREKREGRDSFTVNIFTSALVPKTHLSVNLVIIDFYYIHKGLKLNLL